MERNSYVIYNADCRENLKDLPANSVECIITDPPYFLDRMGKDWNDQELRDSAAKAGIVGGLPVGMKFDKKQGENLQKFLQPICEEFLRILKPGGFCIVFSQGRLYHRTGMALDLAGFEIRDLLGWKYEGQAKAFSLTHFIKRDKSLSAIDRNALINELEGWKTPQLKPQLEPMVMAQKPREGTFVENYQKYKVGLVNTRESYDGMFPGTIMEISKKIRQAESDTKIEHFTVKPVCLIEHLIKLFTREGQTILDPFMGSGSHGLAALKTGRKFIGYEIETKYFAIAQDRLANIALQLNSE